MSFFTFFDRTKKHIAFILILSVFLPSVYFSFPQKAEAVLGAGDTVIEVGPNLFEQTADVIENASTAVATPVDAATNVVSTGLTTADHIKKFVLDPLAMMLAKIIIQQITASTVKWINTGFKGNPAFVQDPEKFFMNIGDQSAATFLSSTNSNFTNFVCSPFSAKVRLALVQSYLSNQTPNRCTLGSIAQNWTNFGKDFYNNGGWDGWFTLTQNDSNNPVGSYMQQKDALLKSIQTRQSHYQAQLSMGNGFLSWETCKKASQFQGPPAAPADPIGTCSDESGDSETTQSECDAKSGNWTPPGDASGTLDESGAVDTSDVATPTPSPTDCPLGTNVNTPGSVISDQLKKVLGSTVDQLGVAQSINQIVGSLLTEMVKKVVGGFGSGGLSGLSQNSAATRSLQNQLQTNATPDSAQFQTVQNQITGTEQDTMNKSVGATAGSGVVASSPSIGLISDGDPTKTGPLIWPLGTPWVDPGFSAVDPTDPDIMSKVTITGTVNADIADTYNLTYRVTNSQGVSATPVMRIVVVQQVVQ